MSYVVLVMFIINFNNACPIELSALVMTSAQGNLCQSRGRNMEKKSSYCSRMVWYGIDD